MASRSVGTTSRFRKQVSPVLLSGIFAFAVVVSAGLLTLKARIEVPQPQSVIVGEFDTVRVPVPIEPVSIGTLVRKIRFRFVDYPKHQVPEDAILSIEPFLEAVTTSPLPASLPLFKSNVSFTAYGTNPVLERIPPGMRAMTIRVDANSSVEGWAGPGTVVDVLLVTADRTSVIAEKVRVLSAERSVAPVEGSSAPNVPSTVTVLVTQDQCLAINTAIPLGKIAFALRSGKDEETWSNTSFSKDSLRGGPSQSEKSSRKIAGYLRLQDGRIFALSDGRWMKAEGLPEGIFTGVEE